MTGKEIHPSVYEKMFEGEEVVKNSGLSIKLKNRSQDSYMSEIVMKGSENGRFFAKPPLGSQIDPSKPIEALISFRTTFGNFIWKKYLIKNDRARRSVTGASYQYSGAEGNVNAPLSKKIKEFIPSIQKKEVESNDAIEKTTKITSSKKTTENNNRYTLKQQTGIIELSKVPNDTVKGNIKTTLLKDVSVKVGNQSIFLKGGTTININNTKKHIISGIANNDQTIKTEYGPLVIKDGALIKFSANKITGINLKDNATLNTKYGQLKAKAQHKANDFDITMTDSGQLTRFTLAETKALEIGKHTFNIPKESLIKMSNNNILSINLSQDISFEISDLKTTISKGNLKNPSLSFNTKNATVSKLFVVTSTDISTSDGPLKVKNNSIIYFSHDENGYSVNRFEIGETKDINTYSKKGKVKLKTAKQGRDIILVNGVVRRIGW